MLFSSNAMALCKDGESRPCTVNGKPGTRSCVRGRLTACIPEPQEIATEGTIHPLYIILGVFYSPPGMDGGKSASKVEYTTGSSTGTSVSASESFKEENKLSVSVSAGAISSVSGSFSYNTSRNSSDTTKQDIKKSKSVTIPIGGPSHDGIDHDRDEIHLLLKPEVSVSMSAIGAQGNWIYWGVKPEGQLRFQYVLVGWLKDPAKW
jgi:hypothetical protein